MMKRQPHPTSKARAVFTALMALVLFAGCALKRVEAQIVRDLAYAKHANADPNLTTLDVYSPPGKSGCAVVVWVHGGGWFAGDKTDLIEPKAQFFLSDDFVFVSVNYRLLPDSPFPRFVQDVSDALGWVNENIAQYGGDPERIVLVGFSSGAHIVSLIAANPNYLENRDLAPKTLKAVISVDSAAYDLPLLSNYYKGKLEGTHGAVFGNDPKIWKSASPITFLNPSSHIPPMLLIYSRGVYEDQVNPNLSEQAENYSAALKRVGADAQVIAFLNRTHQQLDESLGVWNDPLTRSISKFLRGIEGLEPSCQAR